MITCPYFVKVRPGQETDTQPLQPAPLMFINTYFI